jgi:hypothetical protein
MTSPDKIKEEIECKRCGLLKSTVDSNGTKCIPDKRMGTILEGVHEFPFGSAKSPTERRIAVEKSDFEIYCDENPIAENKDWEEELREYFDKTLKAKKPTIKNLDRELLVDFVSSLLKARNREIIEKIAQTEIQYWKDIFDSKPERPRELESDNVAQNFARIEIERWEKLITTLTGEDNEPIQNNN